MTDEIPIDEFLAGIDLGELANDPTERDGSSDAIGGHIVNWRTLTTEHAPAEWARLREWVEWLCNRYTLDSGTIPECWWRHSALVEELSALHTAWLASFDETDAGYGPMGWHERLAAARPRLRQHYAGQCQRGHQDDPVRTFRDTSNDEEWHTWIRQSRSD